MMFHGLMLRIMVVAALVAAAGCQSPVEDRNGQKPDSKCSVTTPQATAKDAVAPFHFVLTGKRHPHDHYHRLTIVQDGKVKFTWNTEHTIGFMKELEGAACGPGYHRMSFEDLDEKTDYRDCLWDATGNGDRRYMTLGEWFGGNGKYNYRGFLIDVKDDFRIIGEIPIGECCDYDIKNPDLIFDFPCEIAYFGSDGYASVSVKLKLNRGKPPTLVFPKKVENDPWEHEKVPDDLTPFQRYVDLICVWCNLATRGRFQKAAEIARQKGFAEDEIRAYYPEMAKMLDMCELTEHLRRINGVKSFASPDGKTDPK